MADDGADPPLTTDLGVRGSTPLGRANLSMGSIPLWASRLEVGSKSEARSLVSIASRGTGHTGHQHRLQRPSSAPHKPYRPRGCIENNRHPVVCGLARIGSSWMLVSAADIRYPAREQVDPFGDRG